MSAQIALLGSSTVDPRHSEETKQILHQLAKIASQHRATILTGTGGGVSALAAEVFPCHDVEVIGISPSSNAEEHESETGEDPAIYSSMIFTGMGFEGRNVTLVRSADVVAAVGGQTGTLNELTIAWDEGKIVALGDDTSFLGCASSIFHDVSRRVPRKSDRSTLYHAATVSRSLTSALEHHANLPRNLTRLTVEELFQEAGAVQYGHFEIKSGHHTTEFWEKAILLERGDIVSELARRLSNLVIRLNPDIIVGPPIGGAFLASAVGKHSGIRSLFFDKNESGMPRLARSYRITKHSSALIIDDIISAGNTIAAAENELDRLGLKCLGSAVLVDRRGGSPASDVAQTRYPIQSLLKKNLPINVTESECANCASGGRPTINKDEPVIIL